MASVSHEYTHSRHRIQLRPWNPSSKTSFSIGHILTQMFSCPHIVGVHFSVSLLILRGLILLNWDQNIPIGHRRLHQYLSGYFISVVLRTFLYIIPTKSRIVPTGQTYPHQNLPKRNDSATNMAKVGTPIQIAIQMMVARFKVKPKKKKEPIEIPINIRNAIFIIRLSSM